MVLTGIAGFEPATSRLTDEHSTTELYAKVVASRRSPSIRKAGFEPATPWIQTKYSNQTELLPFNTSEQYSKFMSRCSRRQHTGKDSNPH